MYLKRHHSYLLTLIVSLSIFACDDSDDTTTDPVAGETAGTMAGEMAGEAAGEAAGEIADGAVMTYTGTAVQWLTQEPEAGLNVCLYGDEDSCTTTDENGIFVLEDVPQNAEIIITIVSEDEARFAFPLVTGTEDPGGVTLFTVVNRAIADVMIALGGEPGIDDSKSIITFYAGHSDFTRGLPGVEFAYDGPDTSKSPNYIVPSTMDPGVTVAGPDVNSTSAAGNGFVSNIEPGEYTVTFTDSQDRECSPVFGWPAEEGAPANTFRTQLIEGFASFTLVNCVTDATVNSTGTINDFSAMGGLAGADVCLRWGTDDEGEFLNFECSLTEEDGTIAHSDLPGDTQILAEISKEGYINVVATIETVTEDFIWAVLTAPTELFNITAATAGLTLDDTKGHASIFVWDATNQGLDGYKLSIAGSDAQANYVNNLLIDPSLTETTLDGVAAFFNVEPGNYVVNVEKEGVLCTTSSWSWTVGQGQYALPIRANSFTQTAIVCIDEPSPRFPEPAEPIAAPMCVEDDAATNCAEVCRQFVECGQALCPGLQGVSEWEITASGIGMKTACESVCETSPELVDVVCAHTSCNETLSLTVDSQTGFGAFCDNGFNTILETATTAAEAADSMVTSVFGLVSESEAVIDILSDNGPLTVFLPIDMAFGDLDPAVLETVMEDPAERDRILSYHVVEGGLYAGAVVQAITDGAETIDTLGGTVTLEKREDGQIYIGGAMVISTDLFASNGVIHLIDSVIIPE